MVQTVRDEKPVDVPAGTVTFLFTDIEGSTRLLEQLHDEYAGLLEEHHALFREIFSKWNGKEIDTQGDAFFVAFSRANDAIQCAIETQVKFAEHTWPTGKTVKVRMGLHTGEPIMSQVGYIGMDVHRAAYIASSGNGGQVLLSQASADLVHRTLPPGVTLKDLGEHRLKNMEIPERLFQLCIPGLPQDFSPLPNAVRYRHNLPTQLTNFIGREAEIVEIKQAISEHRMVTLTGSGGVGKTRLALKIAGDALDQFPSGTWLVELAPVTDPDFIPKSILSAVGLQAQPGKNDLESLKDFFREKTSLLILDNCEHLIDASAKLAKVLLEAAPGLKILASSREALGVKGEQAWHVPSLSTPDIKNLPPVDQFSQYEALRMFVDRAVLVEPHFSINKENALAVANICHRLDGIPLAIELAAVRLRILSPEQIAARLDDCFRLLTGGSRTALPRHQTLRSLIDWSHSLLSEPERQLFRRLSVFAGGCTLEQVESICADEAQSGIQPDEILDMLTQLVDKSLVAADQKPGLKARYRLLETVRQYAREKLAESGESNQIRNNHLQYFLNLVEEAEPQLHREEQLDWSARLERNYDNLRAALEWAIYSDQNDMPEAGLRMVDALYWFWNLKGDLVEGMEWLNRAIEKSKQNTPTVAYARALGFAGNLEWTLTLYSQPIKNIDESLALCRALGDEVGTAFVLYLKGLENIIILNDNLAGKVFIDESLEINKRLDIKDGIGRAYYGLGHFFLSEKDFSRAYHYYEESLKITREIGERRGMGYVLGRLSLLSQSQGNMLGAQKYLEESVSLVEQLGNKWAAIQMRGSLGSCALIQGDYQKAWILISSCLDFARDMGYQVWIYPMLASLGLLARIQGNFEQAENLGSQLLNQAREKDDKYYISVGLSSLGALARARGNYAQSRSLEIQALENVRVEKNQEYNIDFILRESAALGLLQHQAIEAAKLYSAAEGLRKPNYIDLAPYELADLETNLSAARAQLDAAAFEDAWAEGQVMTIEQAIDLARKVLENQT